MVGLFEACFRIGDLIKGGRNHGCLNFEDVSEEAYACINAYSVFDEHRGSLSCHVRLSGTRNLWFNILIREDAYFTLTHSDTIRHILTHTHRANNKRAEILYSTVYLFICITVQAKYYIIVNIY